MSFSMIEISASFQPIACMPVRGMQFAELRKGSVERDACELRGNSSEDQWTIAIRTASLRH